MKMHYWRIFVAVCESGSVSAAARKLFVTQPTVSRVIMEIERHYGLRLFERINNHLILTSDGLAILGYARELLLHCEQMETAIMGLSNRHRLRVGLSPTFSHSIIMDILKKFQIQYPDVEVTLCVDQASYLIERMTAGEFDIVVSHRMQESKSFLIQEIPVDEHFFFAKRKNISPDKQILSFDELKKKKLCLKIKGHVSRDMLDSLTQERYGLLFSPVLESVDARAVVGFVLNIKNSVGMLPYWELHEYLVKDLISIIQVREFKSTRNFCVISRKRKTAPGEKMFVSLVQSVLQDYKVYMEKQLQAIGYPYVPDTEP